MKKMIFCLSALGLMLIAGNLFAQGNNKPGDKARTKSNKETQVQNKHVTHMAPTDKNIGKPKPKKQVKKSNKSAK
jgi:hypothetical protein